jgi:DnaJ-class molecular chaperone
LWEREINMTETQVITQELKPLHIAQKCPVCNGWGTVSFKRVPCHACTGKGFILIPAEIEREKGYGRQNT